jgi:hypothetical protein
MVSSNLSQNCPHILPFEDVYLVKRDEFEKLFPRNVVTHMEEYQRRIPNFQPPKGYFLFPEARNLPVVVATRISLSFPVLISMIPLHTIGHDVEPKVRFDFKLDPEQPERAPLIVLKKQSGDNQWVEVRSSMTIDEKDLQPNWFSDGGICSNFPIHFFDSWLPTRPTFGVNLTSQLGEQSIRGAAKRRRFSCVAQQPLPAGYAVLPSAVSYDTDVYLPQPGSETAPEEKVLKRLAEVMTPVATTGVRPFDHIKLMKDQRDPAQNFPYVRDQAWCKNAENRLTAISKAISGWGPPDLSEEPPLPEPVLRVAPEI